MKVESLKSVRYSENPKDNRVYRIGFFMNSRLYSIVKFAHNEWSLWCKTDLSLTALRKYDYVFYKRGS